MTIRTSEAEWRGDLKGGQGEIKLGSGAFTGSYSFHSRFEDGKGTNPEELIAAAHAGCFSMALAATLAAAGHPAGEDPHHGEGAFRPRASRSLESSSRPKAPCPASMQQPSRRRRRKPRRTALSHKR